MLLAQPSCVACYFISLQKYKISESADTFSLGAPFIGLEVGRAEDRRLRRGNELRRLRAHVHSYEHYPAGAQEYLSYRVREIDESRLATALPRVFDMASVNAQELIALGNKLRELVDVPVYEKVWSEYTRLVKNF